MIWMWLACQQPDKPPEKSAISDSVPQSEQALRVINHLQEKQATRKEFSIVQVWQTGDIEAAERLAAFMGGSVVSAVDQLDSHALLLVLLTETEPLRLPRHPNMVAILQGEWSEAQKRPLVRQTIGIASVNSSSRRYTNPHTATLESKMMAVALDVAAHFRIDRPDESWNQATLDHGLWGMVNPAWLLKDSSDLRIRWDETSLDIDSLGRLSQFRYGYSPSVIQQLVVDVDPWVRAQAVMQVSDLSVLEQLVTDDSSVVRVATGHRLGEMLRRKSSEQGCQMAQQLSRSMDAYVRWKGAYALRFCPNQTTALVTLLSDVDIDVQREAVLSMQYHPRISEYFQIIVDLTKHENSFVRRWAWVTLSTVKEERVTSHLDRCMTEEPSVLAREACAEGLHQRGRKVNRPIYRPPMAEDVSNTERVLQHPDPTFRKDAAKFIANRPNGERTLRQLMIDGDGEVRKTAVEALGFQASSAVWQALSDSDLDVVITALESIRIGKIAGDLDLLIPLLNHSDTEVRLRSVEAMTIFSTQLTSLQWSGLEGLRLDGDERIRAAIMRVQPSWIAADEPSLYVRYQAALRDATLLERWPTDGAVQSAKSSSPTYWWIQGVIQDQDDLLHEIYSWNDPHDKPDSHKALRPPRFSEYGHPNRG